MLHDLFTMEVNGKMSGGLNNFEHNGIYCQYWERSFSDIGHLSLMILFVCNQITNFNCTHHLIYSLHVAQDAI